MDSQVADDVTMQLGEELYSLPFVNGCAVFRSNELPHNAEGELVIHVSGNGNTNVYRRTLINGGSNDGFRQHQFL